MISILKGEMKEDHFRDDLNFCNPLDFIEFYGEYRNNDHHDYYMSKKEINGYRIICNHLFLSTNCVFPNEKNNDCFFGAEFKVEDDICIINCLFGEANPSNIKAFSVFMRLCLKKKFGFKEVKWEI